MVQESSAPQITIPDIEEHNGRIFETKSGRGRQLPLTDLFREFLLGKYTAWRGQEYMIHSEAKGKAYRWDPRQPFETYMENQGFRMRRDKNKRLSDADRDEIKRKWGDKREVTLHTMRHSYGSHLIRDGVPIARVALWMGDRIKTVERNYLHEDVMGTGINIVFDRPSQDSKAAGAGRPYNKDEDYGFPERWIWTATTPKVHQNLHSITDTINSHEIFTLIIGQEIDQRELSCDDWQTGILSTLRSRLKFLEQLGWIQRNPG